MNNRDEIIRRLEALLRLKTERGATQSELVTIKEHEQAMIEQAKQLGNTP